MNNKSKKTAEELIQQMNKSIIHRGPDDQGFFCEIKKNTIVTQGQVRLSIIDLSNAGFQPMFYNKKTGAFSQKHNTHLFKNMSKKNIRIVFNGEIYNFQEIKTKLINKGYYFSSNSDTEVILASYLEYGENCIHHFNGMRSFVIYDPIKNQFFCSRDRLGKKPFYYYFDNQNFIFSSEIKGILEHKNININNKQNINQKALDFYFSMGYIPSPRTIYKNIKKLEAGHNLIIKIKKGSLDVDKRCYYKIPKYQPINNKKKLIEEGKKLLEESIKIRMITSDVPVGAFLSGGLDSSTVVAKMINFTAKENLNTFSIGFEGKYDESNYINIVKNVFGTNHHHKYFKKQDFEKILKNIYYFYDEPFADYSNFPTLFVSKLAKKFVTVSLSGDGGDEIFGGYMMHQVAAQMNIIYKIPRFLRKLFYQIIPKTSNNLSILSKIKEAFRVSLYPKEEFYAQIGGSTIYKPEIYKKRTKQKLRKLLNINKGNFIQSIIDFDLLYNTLADNFLVKVDRASMSQALEVRSPFLDYRWIEWSRFVPTKWKVNWRKTKILMRKIIKDIVPDKITNRGKQGFEPPIKDRILEDKYINQIKIGLEKLYDKNIINNNRYHFYKNQVLKKNNSIFNVYKIRLLLLLKWYEQWIEKIF